MAAAAAAREGGGEKEQEQHLEELRQEVCKLSGAHSVQQPKPAWGSKFKTTEQSPDSQDRRTLQLRNGCGNSDPHTLHSQEKQAFSLPLSQDPPGISRMDWSTQ